LVVATQAVTLPTVLAQAVAAIALGLLAASGTAKLVDPEPTTGAMGSARLPASRLITYLLGIAEFVIAVTSLAVGGLAVIGAAALYAGFAIFTFAATRKRIPVQSCGCFGRDDTPPSPIHVSFNLVAMVSLLAVASLGAPPVDWSLPGLQLTLYLGFTAIGVYVSYLMLSSLPQLLDLSSTS
jgi:uncharacterized membrane protein YphA (DoxX/SURF4 family)